MSWFMLCKVLQSRIVKSFALVCEHYSTSDLEQQVLFLILCFVFHFYHGKMFKSLDAFSRFSNTRFLENTELWLLLQSVEGILALGKNSFALSGMPSEEFLHVP